MRVVLDTNIYIAAALQGHLAEDILRMATSAKLIKLVVSEEILNELQEKLLIKFNWLKEDVDRFLIRIRKIAGVVEVKERISIITRDPKDNKILECALAGEADLIVTLDQDLIKLKHFKGIGIIHPKTFSWTFPEYLKKAKEN